MSAGRDLAPFHLMVELEFARRMPLGVPSRLLLEPVGCSVEREAGYILLGGLCFSLPPDVLTVCVPALLGLQGALTGLLCGH